MDTWATDTLRPVVDRAVRLLLERYAAPQDIEAVILTGSLARGEGSVLRTDAGPRLLGDIEMLVIVRRSWRWGAVRRRMVRLAAEATREIGDDGRIASIEFTPAAVTYLRHAIRPCIFAWDLRQYGKVLHGRLDMLEEMRPFGVEALPREDAIELVMNRLVELSRTPVVTDAGGGQTPERGYQLAKTVLDLAGSALAFAGRYASRYADRPAAFAGLRAAEPGLADAVPDLEVFQDELARAVECKLRPSLEALGAPDVEARAARVAGWAQGIWLWEMRRLLDRPEDPLPGLVERYLRREGAARRFRGWLKYTLHPLRPPGSFSLARAGRLLWTASPQNLAYAAAMLSHAGLRAGRDDWSARAESLLPVPGAPGPEAVLRRAGELWYWLVRNN